MQNEDEEARYSSVARGAKDPTDSSFDTRNDETFGSVTPKEPTKPWSGAANSVAAITGRCESFESCCTHLLRAQFV